MTSWRVAAVEWDGEAVRVEIEDGDERRHVVLAAGVLAVLGCLPRRFDGAHCPPGATETRLDEWGRPR